MDQVKLGLITPIGTRKARNRAYAEVDSLKGCHEGVMRRVVYCKDFHTKQFEIRPFLIIITFPLGTYPRGERTESVGRFAESIDNMSSNATHSCNSDFH